MGHRTDCKQSHSNNRTEAGVFIVMAALMLTVLFGFLGLGTDMGWLYHQRRLAQTAADAGAIYGAQQIKRGKKNLTDVQTEFSEGVSRMASRTMSTESWLRWNTQPAACTPPTPRRPPCPW